MALGNLGTTMKDVKAKMGVEVTTDLVSVSSAHFIGSSRFLVSAVAGAMGWAGGISAIFNTYNGRRRRNREAIQDPRLALQRRQQNFSKGSREGCKKGPFPRWKPHSAAPPIVFAATFIIYNRTMKPLSSP